MKKTIIILAIALPITTSALAKEYAVREEVLNATLQYLASRPYSEVAQLISEIRQVRQVEEAPRTITPDKVKEAK
jgi:hypothetical protein